MPSSSCFYTCIQRTCSRKFSYLFLHIKRTPAKNPASVPTVSLYNHISYKSYRNLFRSRALFIYGNGSNRLTWSNFLTLVPSGFASLLFSRFAFKKFFPKIKYHVVFFTSIILDKKSGFFLSWIFDNSLLKTPLQY